MSWYTDIVAEDNQPAESHAKRVRYVPSSPVTGRTKNVRELGWVGTSELSDYKRVMPDGSIRWIGTTRTARLDRQSRGE